MFINLSEFIPTAISTEASLPLILGVDIILPLEKVNDHSVLATLGMAWI